MIHIFFYTPAACHWSMSIILHINQCDFPSAFICLKLMVQVLLERFFCGRTQAEKVFVSQLLTSLTGKTSDLQSIIMGMICSNSTHYLHVSVCGINVNRDVGRHSKKRGGLHGQEKRWCLKSSLKGSLCHTPQVSLTQKRDASSSSWPTSFPE